MNKLHFKSQTPINNSSSFINPNGNKFTTNEAIEIYNDELRHAKDTINCILQTLVVYGIRENGQRVKFHDVNNNKLAFKNSNVPRFVRIDVTVSLIR